MNGRNLLPDGNCALLRQGVALLEDLSDALYAERRGSWAPVGAQYRHILEHYQAFFRGLPAGRVDYDARDRLAELESNRTFALQTTLECIDHLEGLSGAADSALSVQMDCGEAGNAPDWRPSSAGRELQFLSSHTVHHFALIRLLLEGAGVELDQEFGTAPSTLAFQRARGR